MTYGHMLETVRYEGAYPTRERAEQAVRNVLTALGRQLTGEVRAELTDRLPLEAALTLNTQLPDAEQLTGWAFVKDLATRTNATPATARWEAGTVLSVLARLAGPDLLHRLLDQLPDGWALLFGQAQLLRPQHAA
ncbi:DUF2267 domain-containing protein [Streptomyces racemochromogenes]|uniref:DUF2267 domain-containing protein n=1 Tax=Streptomyces racemochromogenes TaxID=67353 RepID=A0ABW7P8F2_9ACTN